MVSKNMKPWENLGVVETIYEEDYENSSVSTFLSPSLSSPSTPLHSRVDAWSSARGCEPDVLIRVQESCFHLHKDALTSRSIYFKRQLSDHVSQLTVSPPLNITSSTFTLVADFCYGNHIIITPFNVTPLRIAADLLGMTDNDNLRQITENYFCRVVTVNRELTSVVFCSCLSLLPESETTASFASRCVEAFTLTEDKENVIDCVHDVVNISPVNFLILLASLRRRFDGHDIMCEMINAYIEENNDNITEEQKTQICSLIDCQKLSPSLLVNSVQNPKMPLQFIVRAMLSEHLNTRRSLVTATVHRQGNLTTSVAASTKPTTLGAILQRDAAMRHMAQLKAEMESTSSRIQSLEKELISMKNILHDQSDQNSCDVLDSTRSISFSHIEGNLPFVDENQEIGDNSVMRSARSESFNCVTSRNVERNRKLSAQNSGVCSSPTFSKNIRQRFMKRLKNAFGKRGSAEVKKNSNVGVGGVKTIIY